jgi:hypothetical protein
VLIASGAITFLMTYLLRSLQGSSLGVLAALLAFLLDSVKAAFQ